MQSIFKELEQAFQLVKGTENEDIKIKALEELENYINSGVWYEGRGQQEFFKYYRLPTHEYAKRTGRTKEGVRLILKRASDKIRDRIGYNRIYTVINGTREEIEMLIKYIKYGTRAYIPEYLVLPEVINEISHYRNVDDEYSLEELEQELIFLNKYSFGVLNNKLKSLDKEKLSFIFQTLKSKEGADLERKVHILEKIKGGI